MTERVSRTILLCEDDPQEQLVRAYFRQCGLNTQPPYLLSRNASRAVHGGNVTWVIREFARELQACRQRHRAHANTLLIVVVDSDHLPVRERTDQLREQAAFSDDDPLVLLIPRRHVETWVRSALGTAVNEVDDYKRPEPERSEIRAAARQVHGWARDNPPPGPTCVASLHDALTGWRRIG